MICWLLIEIKSCRSHMIYWALKKRFEVGFVPWLVAVAVGCGCGCGRCWRRSVRRPRYLNACGGSARLGPATGPPRNNPTALPAYLYVRTTAGLARDIHDHVSRHVMDNQRYGHVPQGMRLFIARALLLPEIPHQRRAPRRTSHTITHIT